MEHHANALLVQAAVYFAAAVIAVLIAQRLGLGSVAGYLLAGVAIGPWGLKVVGDVQDIRGFAELGVVFLPFHFGGWYMGEDRRRFYPPGADPIVLGESANTVTTYGYDPVTFMQETKVTLCQIRAA